MCHQKEKEKQQSKYKKATVIGTEGEILFPVKVVGPVIEGEIRVYGNPAIVPNGAAWLRFKAVFAKDGKQVF